MASRKYSPMKGDVIDGAMNLLKDILDGKVTKYPQITLKIAGMEANATKKGYPQVKEILREVVKAIRSAVEGAGIKRKVIRAEDVEIPPEVRQKFLPAVQRAYEQLASLKAGNKAKVEMVLNA